VIAAAVITRLVLAVMLWEPGWSALTWDDFSRVELAREWAASPELAPDLLWLPGPIWVTGTVFRVLGDAFRGNPMLLTALVNTVAVLATAGVVGWSAYRLFASKTSGVISFGVTLFAPWAVFTSLSGLGEPIYYLAVAGTVATTVRWLQVRRLRWLAGAAACVSAAAVCRYEGWVLLGSWAFVLAMVEVGRPGQGYLRRLRTALPQLGVIASAGIVPIAWIALSYSRTGDPLYFVEATARAFTSAYGTIEGIVARLMYYPMSLLRSAPLMLTAAVAAAWLHHRDRIVRIVVGIVALQFIVLYVSSVASPVVGAFNERFLFAIAVALAPLVGGLAQIATTSRRALAAAVAAAAIAATLTGWRIADRPVEWTHPPDLLALTESLGAVATLDSPVTIVVGPGMDNDLIPLVVRNGDRVIVASDPAVPITGPTLDDDTMWVERLPARIADIAMTPTATIGRYAVYGGRGLPVTVCPGCDGWTLHDELGTERSIPAGPYVPLEFTGDDPPPGTEAMVWRTSPVIGTGRIELRWLYGRGFNRGRIEVQVRVDGAIAMRRDIADHDQWISVEFDVPTPGARIEVVVVALPGIEAGWAWGRASTVMIRSFEVRQ